MLQMIKTHMIGSIISSGFFIGFFYLYRLLVEGEIDLLAAPFIFLFVFPIYLLFASPLAIIIRSLLQRRMSNYILLLTIILTIISFFFQYTFTTTSPRGVNSLNGNTLLIFFFSLITALPAIVGTSPK